MKKEILIVDNTKNPIKRLCVECRKQFITSEAENEILCAECQTKGYTYKPKSRSYGCEKRKICQTCKYRVRLGNESYHICDCLEQTGDIRDLTADDDHCATYCRKGKKMKVICEVCGQPVCGSVHCPKRPAEAMCCKHCKDCDYYDDRISVVRCVYPQKVKK